MTRPDYVAVSDPTLNPQFRRRWEHPPPERRKGPAAATKDPLEETCSGSAQTALFRQARSQARRMSAEIDRAQLARILGMLGSTHDGEALAAGRMAERMRAAAGTTCFELLSPPPPAIAPRVAVEPPETLDEAIGLCRDYLQHTTEWEQNFCASISRHFHSGRRLSEKQLRVLTRVVRRILDAEMPA